MRAIKPTGNATTEERFATLLRKAKASGWRRHMPLPGKPDFAFPNRRLAIFLDGCFWHGCPRCYSAPRKNRHFWKEKYKANKARDKRVTRALRKMGWTVIRIWEHQLLTVPSNPDALLRRIRQALRS